MEIKRCRSKCAILVLFVASLLISGSAVSSVAAQEDSKFTVLLRGNQDANAVFKGIILDSLPSGLTPSRWNSSKSPVERPCSECSS